MSARTSLAPPSVCLKAQLNAGRPSFLPVCASRCVSVPVEAPAHADPCHQDTCKLRPAANDIIMCFGDQVRRTPAMLEIIKSRHSGRVVQRCVHQVLLGCGPRAQGPGLKAIELRPGRGVKVKQLPGCPIKGGTREKRGPAIPDRQPRA